MCIYVKIQRSEYYKKKYVKLYFIILHSILIFFNNYLRIIHLVS